MADPFLFCRQAGWHIGDAKVRLLTVDKADETQQRKFGKAGDYYKIVNRGSGQWVSPELE